VRWVETARLAFGHFSNRLNEIVLGKRGITADTALRFSRLLKTSSQLRMRMQADGNLHQAIMCAEGVVATCTRQRNAMGTLVEPVDSSSKAMK
jgi:plasmid maintenance system antidote protein VapI